MSIVTIDFETAWSKDYTLSKLSEVEYILDPLFETIMCAIKVNNHPSVVYVGEPAVRQAFAKIDWANSALLAHNCVLGDTEVLTPVGWRRFDELHDDEQVAQFDPATGEMSFTVPQQVVRKPYAGPMLVWDTQFHQGAYTPEHGIYYSTPDRRDWRRATASEIVALSPNNTYIPTSGKLAGGGLDLSSNEARLLEAIRADGSIANGAPKFNLKKSRKIERLRYLCAALQIGLTKSLRADGVTSLYLRASPVRNKLVELLQETDGKKLLPWRLLDAPLSARRALLAEMKHWDGGVRDRSIKITTAKAHDRDVIQALAVCSNTRSRFSTGSNCRGFNEHNSDAVLHRGSLADKTRTKLVVPPKAIPHDGLVYCVSVPADAFVVRRNGVVWITGNCRFDGAILAWRYGISPKLYLDTLSMARATTHWYTGKSSLKVVSEFLGLPPKGTEIYNTKGKWLKDFTPAELYAYEQYNIRDNDNCKEIFDLLRPYFRNSELALIDLVVRMFIEPQVQLDTAVLSQHLANVQQEKARVMESVNAIDKSVLASNAQFAKLLAETGIKVPTKISPTTGEEIPAVARNDWAFKELCADTDLPLEVQALLAARLSVKSTLEETRTANLLRLGTLAVRAPVPLKYSGARTHRLSGDGGTNWQNIQRGSPIRAAISAPPGFRIVHRDASQIEARMVAWLANCRSLLDAFREGRDVYSEFASVIYNQTITRGDKLERFVGKTGILGLGYGCGAAKFRHMLYIGNGGVSLKESVDFAQRIVWQYRDTFPEIPTLWNMMKYLVGRLLGTALQTKSEVRAYITFHSNVLRLTSGQLPVIQLGKDALWLPNGLSLVYPGLRTYTDPQTGKDEVLYRSAYGVERRLYGAKATENLSQALARIVVTDAALRVRSETTYLPFLSTHDSLDYCVPESEAEAMDAELEKQFAIVPAWAEGLPLASEGGWGPTLLAAERMINE